jgi:ribosomal protein L19E
MRSPVLEWIEEGKAAARVNPLGSAIIHPGNVFRSTISSERARALTSRRKRSYAPGEGRRRGDSLAALPCDPVWTLVLRGETQSGA